MAALQNGSAQNHSAQNRYTLDLRVRFFGSSAQNRSAQNGSAQNGSAWQPLVHRVLREVLPLLAVDSDCKIPSVEPLFILNLALIF